MGNVSLGATIREMRRRLGKTMAEFGQMLGVTHASISGYESDKVIPSERVLLQLLPLAETSLEKGRLTRALGANIGQVIDEQTLIEGCDRLVEYMEVLKKTGFPDEDEITPRNAREGMLREFAQILADQKVSRDPLLTRMLRFWRQYGNVADARGVFADAATYMEVQLKVIGSKKPRDVPAAPEIQKRKNVFTKREGSK